jgi:hypothetical protein
MSKLLEVGLFKELAIDIALQRRVSQYLCKLTTDKQIFLPSEEKEATRLEALEEKANGGRSRGFGIMRSSGTVNKEMFGRVAFSLLM